MNAAVIGECFRGVTTVFSKCAPYVITKRGADYMIIGFAIPRFGYGPRGSGGVSPPTPTILAITGGVGQIVIDYTGTLSIAAGVEEINLEVA